ncbi:MAG: hypothetical protein IJ689_03320 [Alphaproteobacteria bacterium]|nr:hypothetical protein [Alphaproteobacteria bacterium]
MNKYILMLGVAGVALGSYCAYAGNSATMTVTATIAHDVSLNVTHALEIGTITVNPSFSTAMWRYDDTGDIEDQDGGFISADTPTFGTFTANIPNPSACSSPSDTCGGLTITGTEMGVIGDMFGPGSGDCLIIMKYTGTANNFIVLPNMCEIKDMSKVTPNVVNSKTVTIEYRAS